MRPIEIIAEIGINHNGSVFRAIDMIWEAKRCGADVAKFQIYAPERILDLSLPIIRNNWDIIKAAELSFGNVSLFKKACDAAGIEFMASVFHPDRVEWTEQIGMKRYKIASRSMYNQELALAVRATKKPAIISYGYFDGRYDALRVIDSGWQVLGSHPLYKTLYCVAEYPTPLNEVYLRRGTFFGPSSFDGFSDHTIGTTASVAAMSLGATIIEKHFTLDRNLPGPDHVCSIEPDGLRDLCGMRNDMEEILYGGAQSA
jgi:sialic acid synthase SpsE